MFNEEKRFYALKLSMAILYSMLLNSLFRLPLHLGIIGIISLISSNRSLKQMERQSAQMFISTLCGCLSLVPLIAICTLYPVAPFHWSLVVIAYALACYFSLTVSFIGRIFNIIFFGLASYVISPLNRNGMIMFIVTRITSVIVGALCSWMTNVVLVSETQLQELARLACLVAQESTALISTYTAQPGLLAEIDGDLTCLQQHKDALKLILVHHENQYNERQRAAITGMITVIEELVLFNLSCKSHVSLYEMSQGYQVFYEKRMRIFQEVVNNRYREYQEACQCTE